MNESSRLLAIDFFQNSLFSVILHLNANLLSYDNSVFNWYRYAFFP